MARSFSLDVSDPRWWGVCRPRRDAQLSARGRRDNCTTGLPDVRRAAPRCAWGWTPGIEVETAPGGRSAPPDESNQRNRSVDGGRSRLRRATDRGAARQRARRPRLRATGAGRAARDLPGRGADLPGPALAFRLPGQPRAGRPGGGGAVGAGHPRGVGGRDPGTGTGLCRAHAGDAVRHHRADPWWRHQLEPVRQCPGRA